MAALNSRKISLFLMNQKGLAVLKATVRELGPEVVACVVSARDEGVLNDYFAEIRTECEEHGIRFFERSDAPSAAISNADVIAVGWRWMISGYQSLIVLHDSLLPRYRGFAPLPNALINGEQVIGVTALLASAEYDRGDIIAQKSVSIRYPIKIQEAIEILLEPCAALAVDAARTISSGLQLVARPQDESSASYSSWRDEDDYRIDWSLEASAIKRFIDALGFPYKGASSILAGSRVRILDAAVEPDVRIEQRAPGKVMFVRDGRPVVTCGAGMLRLLDVRDNLGSASVLPLARFRSRFV
jgi:methionyl-tRNA formyltransferase